MPQPASGASVQDFPVGNVNAAASSHDTSTGQSPFHLPELVQKWAKSLGIQTACSNTDAGPVVSFESLLVGSTPTEIPLAHVLQC